MKRLLLLALVSCHAAEPPRPTPQPPPVVPDAAVAVVVPDAPPPPPVVPPVPELLTTVNTFTIVPAEPITPIKTTAAYKQLGTPRIVRFAINVWAGWAPLVFANQGLKPKRIWKDAKGGDFEVELVSLDDPMALAMQVADGSLHAGWGTVDTLPLIATRLADPRTRPRVVQQIDWSLGGDGLIARDAIESVAKLRGQKIVLAQASPSHFMLLSLLADAGLTPADVQATFVTNAFEAAAAFHASPELAAAVSWSPDIYTLTAKGHGNHMLVGTDAARRLIADVWFARADFARDHPEIMEGLARGILDATDALADYANRATTGDLLDEAFGLPKGTGKEMFGDAHWTNYAENRAFFLDANNPTSFVRTYKRAQELFLAAKVIDRAVPVEQLVDTGVIKRLAARYPQSKNDYEHHWAPPDADAFSAAPVLTHRVSITFFPNSSELHKKVDNKLVDPDIDAKLADLARVVAQFAGARIEIAGHTDASMKGVADDSLVRELSLHRAEAVRDELIKRFQLPPDQLVAKGYGWDIPADPTDPDNHVKNRRIEIRVFPPP